MANENPIPLKSGDAVVVKFAPGTIGERNQGKGWHDARVVDSHIGDTVRIKLSYPSDKAIQIFEGVGIPVDKLHNTGRFAGAFCGTVVRKVSKDKKYLSKHKNGRAYK